MVKSSLEDEMCEEKRVYYRVISGEFSFCLRDRS